MDKPQNKPQIYRGFPTLALVVLILGVVAVAVIVSVFLFTPTLNTSSNSINIAQAKQSADQYVAGINSDLGVA